MQLSHLRIQIHALQIYDTQIVDLLPTAKQPIAPHCFSWTAHGYLRQQITTYDTPKFDKFCWL